MLCSISHGTESHSVVSDSLRPHGLYSPWNSPGQNTGMGRLSLLQGIFPPQGLNQGLLHCRWILYHLSYEGSPHWLWGKFKSKPHGKPFPTHNEGYNQEVKQRQALVRMCRNPNPYTRILKHCWWGWELVWPLWKTAWQVLKWLNQELR